MRKSFSYIITCVLAVLLIACNPGPEKKAQEEKPRIFPQYHQVIDEIIKTSDGAIRGVDLNSKADVIKKAETIVPSDVDSAYLYFEYKIDSITDYSVTYNLQRDSLDEIEVQVNCKDLDLSTRIFSDLKTYYEKKLPNPKEDKGYVVYNCFEGQRKPFVVSLTDNSTPVMGIINLLIYRDK